MDAPKAHFLFTNALGNRVPPRFPNLLRSCELKLGTARVPQNHAICQQFQLINRCAESSLDLHPVAITKSILPSSSSHQDRTILGEFPNDGTCICSGMPFPDDIVARTAAARHARKADEDQKKVRECRFHG